MAKAEPEVTTLPSDICESLQAIDDQLDAIGAELDATQQNDHPAPAILYHYTDDLGLAGILSGGSIWLSDIFKMNDPSELRHGLTSAVYAIRATLDPKNVPVMKVFEQFEKELFANLERFIHFFVASLSRARDDLTQWRNYAADAHGFALGFDGTATEHAFANQAENTTTIHIWYNDPRLEAYSKRMAQLFAPAISLPIGRNLSAKVLSSFLTDASTLFSLAIIRLALLFKHVAYAHEQEYRFLRYWSGTTPPSTKSRTSGTKATRYVEFEWKQTPNLLKEIVIGPAAEMKSALPYAEQCLANAGIATGSVKIYQSDLPYRSDPPSRLAKGYGTP